MADVDGHQFRRRRQRRPDLQGRAWPARVEPAAGRRPEHGGEHREDNEDDTDESATLHGEVVLGRGWERRTETEGRAPVDTSVPCNAPRRQTR